MVRWVAVSLAAVAGAPFPGSAAPSAVQTTTGNDCCVYAVGILNAYSVAELTIMGSAAGTVEAGQRARPHEVSVLDSFSFADGVVRDDAGERITSFAGVVLRTPAGRTTGRLRPPNSSFRTRSVSPTPTDAW